MIADDTEDVDDIRLCPVDEMANTRRLAAILLPLHTLCVSLGSVQVNAEEELTILSSCTVAIGEAWREVVQVSLYSMGEGRKQDEKGQNTDHHNVWSGRKKL